MSRRVTPKRWICLRLRVISLDKWTAGFWGPLLGLLRIMPKPKSMRLAASFLQSSGELCADRSIRSAHWITPNPSLHLKYLSTLECLGRYSKVRLTRMPRATGFCHSKCRHYCSFAVQNSSTNSKMIQSTLHIPLY